MVPAKKQFQQLQQYCPLPDEPFLTPQSHPCSLPTKDWVECKAEIKADLSANFKAYNILVLSSLKHHHCTCSSPCLCSCLSSSNQLTCHDLDGLSSHGNNLQHILWKESCCLKGINYHIPCLSRSLHCGH